MERTEQTSKFQPYATGAQAARLAECYKRAMHLATRERNYEYAHAMFAECVLHDPGNLKFVEGMVQNLRAKAPKGKKSLLKMRLGSSKRIKTALHDRRWKDVIRAGIEQLGTDPWDLATLEAMADACAALHLNEVELVYLKQALDAEPKNVAVNRHCAKSLGRMGQFDQAIACWHRVEKLKGKDAEATQMISRLAEEKLKYPNGRPPLAHVEHTSSAEDQPKEAQHEVALTPKQELEQAISRDPHNLSNYLELAELLIDSKLYDAAESILNCAIACCGKQRQIDDLLEQVHELRSQGDSALTEATASNDAAQEVPRRIPWLEFSLLAALILLILQFIPSAETRIRGAVAAMDIRQWSRAGWFRFNLILLFGLFTVRFGPEIWSAIRQRQAHRRVRGLRGKG